MTDDKARQDAERVHPDDRDPQQWEAVAPTPTDAPDSTSDRYVLGTLEERLVRFLKNEADVTAVDEVGDGIYGILVTAPDGRPVPVSLMVNVTP